MNLRNTLPAQSWTLITRNVVYSLFMIIISFMLGTAVGERLERTRTKELIRYGKLDLIKKEFELEETLQDTKLQIDKNRELINEFSH